MSGAARGGGYWSRLRDAVSAVREVKRAYDADQAALSSEDFVGSDAVYDAVEDRSRRLFALVEDARTGLRDAALGRDVDTPAIAERARTLHDSAATAYDPATYTTEQPRTADPRPVEEAVDDALEHTGTVDQPDDSAATDAGTEQAGAVVDWPEPRAGAATGSYDDLAAAMEEITAGDRAGWQAWFAENDELGAIVAGADYEQLMRDGFGEYDEQDDSADDSADEVDADGGAGERLVIDRDRPHVDPWEVGSSTEPSDRVDLDQVVPAWGVPDPLEQARRALAEVQLDLDAGLDAEDEAPGCRYDCDPWRESGLDDGDGDDPWTR
ncbi:hypothetical protein [Pseudonocardia sp. HH130630-07]|uniref:hypothetical protein n=1 Tax=Pseudonocardia sp. HH130630-07 TaxID=1690815 RepID=UPI0012E9A3BA|nr:hypothetical protein [Pseudonocardia sp. HH130630-07]